MNDEQRKAMFAKQGSKGHGIPSSIRSKDVLVIRNKKNEFVNINKDNVNEIESDEITLGVLSDGEFYRKVIKPNVENIAKRMMRGDFQKEHLFTKKTFIDNLAREAIERYEEMYGSKDNPMHLSVDTKRMIGRNIAEKIFDNARDNIRIDVNNKRKFLVNRKTGFRDEYLKSNDNIATAMNSF